MNRPLPPASMQDPQENADGLEFPGCHPKRIPRSEIASYEGRIEYWDRDTETAMVCEPTTTYHERPAQALAQLCALIGAVRGSPIETFGTCDLLLRDGDGERWRILQADQTVFLHPAATRPQGAAIELLGGHLPDVVLGSLHRLSGWQALALLRLGVPGGVDRGAGNRQCKATWRSNDGPHHLLAPSRGLAAVGREPGVPRMAGARNP